MNYIKGEVELRIKNRTGMYELTTEDGYICMFMDDTDRYEYFNKNAVEEIPKQKYAADALESKTLGKMVDGLINLKDASDDLIADYIDKEFLYGAWGEEIKYKKIDPIFLNNIRGVIAELMKRATK